MKTYYWSPFTFVHRNVLSQGILHNRDSITTKFIASICWSYLNKLESFSFFSFSLFFSLVSFMRKLRSSLRLEWSIGTISRRCWCKITRWREFENDVTATSFVMPTKKGNTRWDHSTIVEYINAMSA